MADKQKTDYWFKRRRYGWGWIPTTWQGWMVVLVTLVVILAGAFTLESVAPDAAGKELAFYLLFVAIIVTSLATISYKKGPKPHWRWGKSSDDKPDEDF